MANVALLIVGSSGSRMHQDIPKQFITVNEKPVIVYTLEAFEKHPFQIGDICALHRRALDEEIVNSVVSCALMIEMGK